MSFALPSSTVPAPGSERKSTTDSDSASTETPAVIPQAMQTPPAYNIPTPPSASSDDHRDTKAFSCILCKQRKIKCDKHYPCNNCTKGRVQCIFRAPAPPRRGKRKPADVNLLARLKKYEDLLQGLGVSIEKLSIDDTSSLSQPQKTLDEVVDASIQQDKNRGELISTGEGKSMYLEDNLWTSLSEELQDPSNFMGDSSDEDETDEPQVPVDLTAYDINSGANQLVFGLGMMSPRLRIPHPPIMQVMRLWEIYQANFDPLTRILHVPTVQNTISEALQAPDAMPKNTRALIYAIYIGALTTISDEQCLVEFGEPRPAMLSRFRLATQQSLIRAGLLKSSDLVIVQAFTIYLLSCRMTLDPRSLWMLSGINGRIAQRIGLHRDGTHLGLSPFETEQRRRLWWQVLMLDIHGAILTGTGHSMGTLRWDVLPPSNVNDADIWPEMTEPPIPCEGPTEMFFCLLRHEFSKFFRATKASPGGGMRPDVSQSTKDALINEAEINIESRFLRYCDFSSNLHTLSNGVGRSAVASMRLMANHPRHRPDKGASMTQLEKDELFNNALKIIEYDSMCYSMEKLKGFCWHVRSYFQYHAFVYLLSELCHRTQGDEVSRAWQQIAQVFDNHPEMMGQRSLQIAVGKLVCKAWNQRVVELIRLGQQPIPSRGVAVLLAQHANNISSPSDRSGFLSPSTATNSNDSPSILAPSEAMSDLGQPIAFGQSMGTAQNWPDFEDDVLVDPIFAYEAANLGSESMDWGAWDNLMQEEGAGLSGL